MTIHVFDTDIAVTYGVNAAVLLQNLGYWIQQNEANETNFFDGHYWTYNSRRAYRELFPYMSERQINTAFQKLIDAGLIITGNYNKVAYDRTLWYALTKKGKSILHFDIMDSAEVSNGNGENVTPIPNINTDENTDVNTDISAEFEALWKLYPRKLGKAKAEKAYKKARENGVTFAKVERGIKLYCAQIFALKTEEKFVKHGSTWFNGECWNDDYGCGAEVPQTEPDELDGIL